MAMQNRNFTSTRNPCKLCAPLGASFAYRGIMGCIPLIHGSQGCSTYIRRYGISHFREPIDIASSNFTEASAIFGGGDNLKTAIRNVTDQYNPAAIGIASTCLSETMGENVPMYLSQYSSTNKGEGDNPLLLYASTPSYRGTHIDGFFEAVFAAVSSINDKTPDAPEAPPPATEKRINLVSGFVSTEDIRELHEMLASFGVPYTLVPDYSQSLDGPSWDNYQKLPDGGTTIEDIGKMKHAAGTIAFDLSAPEEKKSGLWLEKKFGVPSESLPLPIGIENTDRFFSVLSRFTGNPVPEPWTRARGRLVDAYIDGHKYCSGKKAIVTGDEEFVLAISSFLDETGILPVIAATGAKSPLFRERLARALPNACKAPIVADDTDFETVLEIAREKKADFVIGNSKSYYLARNLAIPLIRVGFPVHDRMGGQRILHLGYRGTLSLFDRICNAIMKTQQEAAESGWTYI